MILIRQVFVFVLQMENANRFRSATTFSFPSPSTLSFLIIFFRFLKQCNQRITKPVSHGDGQVAWITTIIEILTTLIYGSHCVGEFEKRWRQSVVLPVVIRVGYSLVAVTMLITELKKSKTKEIPCVVDRSFVLVSDPIFGIANQNNPDPKERIGGQPYRHDWLRLPIPMWGQWGFLVFFHAALLNSKSIFIGLDLAKLDVCVFY